MAKRTTRNADKEAGNLSVDGKHLYLNCIDGCIELIEVQLEGKKKSDAISFMNGAGRNYL